MIHTDRRRAESFGARAERYDRSRPTYPPALLDDLLGPGPAAGAPVRVLDVGCGTGIAARLMLARGADVLGVEVDDRMAAVARSHGVAVEAGAFETWPAAGRTFDLVTAAQAWHWVDPVAGAVKAASVLRPGGRLALFWNVGRAVEEVSAAMDDVYARLAPGLDQGSVLMGSESVERFAFAAGGIETSGRFGEPVTSRFPWTRRYTRDEWLDQLPTHSDHSGLEPEKLEPLLAAVGEVIDAAGGSFEMRFEAVMVSARLA